MYRSRSKKTGRVDFSTTLKKDILIKLKQIAAQKEQKMNELIEEAVTNYFKL